jgi:hypothetical protein
VKFGAFGGAMAATSDDDIIRDASESEAQLAADGAGLRDL